MSRHGYSDGCDGWELIMWRGAVASAIRGRRGQQLLREMRDALDAMPDKRLISHELIDGDGEVCAIGSVGVKRHIDMTTLDPEKPEQVAAAFGVSPALVKEISYENDDDYGDVTPEIRWRRMRNWVERNILQSPTPRTE